ncbi:MAG: ABC transporter permease [Anaerolineae bacterium]
MTRYVVQRLVLLVPVLIGISLVTFAILRLIPGDPCRIMLGERATEAICADFNERMGLDDTIPVQYAHYLANAVQGDLGTSIKTGQPVTNELTERLPMTIELATTAMIIAVVLGVGAGVLAAVRRGSSVDLATMVVSNVGVSMPIFWLGLVLMFLLAFKLRLFPPSGRLTVGVDVPSLAAAWGLGPQNPAWLLSGAEFLSRFYVPAALLTGQFGTLFDALKHLVLPSLALATIPAAIIARMTRASLLEVLGQEYVRTARAKGLRQSAVLYRHAMKNALLPIVTVIGLQAGYLLGGAFLTETVFSLPGVGRLVVDRILARDYPVVQGAVLVIASLFVFVNLFVDLTYAWIDPRIHYD